MAVAQAGIAPQDGEATGQPAKRGKKKLILLALGLLLLGGGGAAAFFLGLVPGMGPSAAPAGSEAGQASAPDRRPVLVALPDITANLNAPGRRAAFIRVKSQVEVMGPADAAALQAAMPRLVDLFTVYLRELRPEDLRGSAGTHRLREELIARANVAAAPVRVTDVLFIEILAQ